MSDLWWRLYIIWNNRPEEQKYQNIYKKKQIKQQAESEEKNTNSQHLSEFLLSPALALSFSLSLSLKKIDQETNNKCIQCHKYKTTWHVWA